ncbi:MAG: tetratricopeptide (TPR) repeat protein [Myxococcota bacterium]|jgi:tetratricopeptide (TPR) repeat protein
MRRATPLVAVALALLVFGQVVGFGFVWDDHNLIEQNPFLEQSDTVWRGFTTDFWELSNAPRDAKMYRPLVIASYWLERQAFGTSPAGPHTTNLLLHMLCALLLWLLMRRLGVPAVAAAVGCALFAVHPVQVEAVSNIASRGDLLATALLLGGLITWRDGRFFTSLSLMLAACLAKEAAIVGPVLAALIAPADSPLRARISAILIWPAYFGARFLALGSATPFGDFSSHGGALVLRYAARVLWPVAQAPYTPIETPDQLLVLGSLAVVAAIVFAVSRLPDEPRIGLLWFGLALGPVAEVIPVGARFADLLLYLPMCGVAIAAAWLASRARPALLTLTVVVLLAGGVSALRAPVWADDIALWTHGLAIEPGHPAMTVNLATALRRNNEPAKGCALLESIADRTDRDSATARAQYNLGNCRLEAKRFQAAATAYERALDISNGALHQAAYNLAMARMSMGDLPGADKATRQLVEGSPLLPGAWHLRGVVLGNSGRIPEACEAFARALSIQEDHGPSRAAMRQCVP